MSQAAKWAMRYTAAHQYYEREGHLTVPRKHIETVILDSSSGKGEDRERREVSLKLGAWVSNRHTRAWLCPREPGSGTDLGVPSRRVIVAFDNGLHTYCSASLNFDGAGVQGVDLCWVEVEFVRGATLADLCSYRSATWAQPVQAALSMPAAAARVVSVKVGQQVRCVVGMEDDRVSGTCGSQEPLSVRITDTGPAGKHCDGFVGR
ncbi:helicase associated domain-containing protein [Streptomyces sp. NPDC058861]|uniref:helicase associated domain-containing protein n=1 Tax=Streptomyces sp. NPDC058861 TaxID=3346653 RepID=UPI00368A2527